MLTQAQKDFFRKFAYNMNPHEVWDSEYGEPGFDGYYVNTDIEKVNAIFPNEQFSHDAVSLSLIDDDIHTVAIYDRELLQQMVA